MSTETALLLLLGLLFAWALFTDPASHAGD
jgi:hypothetical protein